MKNKDLCDTVSVGFFLSCQHLALLFVFKFPVEFYLVLNF